MITSCRSAIISNLTSSALDSETSIQTKASLSDECACRRGGGEMDQAKANASDDLFTTETAGLPEVLGPDVTRLADGDRLDLRIGPVRKNIDGAELRMLAYNGSIPGPTLQVDQGSEITVQVTNDGDVGATMHWHGMRLENM